MTLSFSALRDGFPIEPKSDLFAKLGGEWPKLVDNPNYANTCSIRMSVAFQNSGIKIPSQYKEAIDGKGNPIIIKVRTLKNFLENLEGPSSWGMSKNPGDDIGSVIPAYQGIIAYHADWDDATGHFDLWDRDSFIGSGALTAIKDGYAVEIWRL